MTLLNAPTDVYAQFLTHHEFLNYVGAFVAFLLTQTVALVGVIMKMLSTHRDRISAADEKSQEAVDKANNVEAMVLRFREDNKDMMNDYVSINTKEHEKIAYSLEKTSENLGKQSELLMNLSSDLKEHLGFHKGQERFHGKNP